MKQLEAQGELDLYYLDEAGFCLIPCIPYGWQMIGQTEEIESQRSQRLNVLGLMTRMNQLLPLCVYAKYYERGRDCLH